MKYKQYASRALLIGLFTIGCDGSGSAPVSTSKIVINEVMPANQTTCADEQGNYPDWIELFNNGDAAVDLGGYSLTDSPATPRKAVLAAGVSIAAKGVLTLWVDGDTADGPTHLPFKLSKAGETMMLFDPSGQQLDVFTWTGGQSDISFARGPDGTGAFATCARPTCGKVNGSACAK